MFVADEIGRETKTPVGVTTLPPVAAETFNIVIGCGIPVIETYFELKENVTKNLHCNLFKPFIIEQTCSPLREFGKLAKFTP